jgi:GST-like protein
VLEWLMFQMGSFGPLLGQAHHFRLYAPEKIPYAYDRYTNEARRLYGVLDRRLQGLAYVAETYSIADIALFPWARRHPRQGIDLADHPNVLRWFDTIDARPAVQCALKVLADGRQTLTTEQARRNLFGDVQYQKR